MNLPVLAGSATAVSRIVTEQDIGWSVGGSPEDFGALIRRVDRAELERKRANLLRVRLQYTWAERAREVARIADHVRRPQQVSEIV